MKSRIRYIINLCTLACALSMHAVDGDLDTTFGMNGLAQFPFGDDDAVANAVVVRYDGVIVVAGAAGADVTNNDADVAVMWISPDGMSVQAMTSTVIGTNSQLFGLAVQPDNKVVAVGGATIDAIQRFVIIRYNVDGTLDTTFNSQGLYSSAPGTVVVPFTGNNGQTSTAQARAVALTQDGSIVAVGQAQDAALLPGNTNSFFAVARVTRDGILDSRFAATGYVVYSDVAVQANLVNSLSIARAVAIQSMDGQEKIVFAGSGQPQGFTQPIFQMGRINQNGLLDLSFNAGRGVLGLFLASSFISEASGVDILPDGRAIAVGFSLNTMLNQITMVLTRRLLDGSPDTTFGPLNDGIQEYNVPGVSTALSGVIVQHDSKPVVAGELQQSSFLVGRFTDAGLPDSTFGTGVPNTGLVQTNFPVSAVASALAFTQQGQIVVAGSSRIDNDRRQFALARYIDDNSVEQVFARPTITSPESLINCNDPRPLIAGTAQNPSNVTLFIDGAIAARTATQGATDTWSYQVPSVLATGKHTFQVVAQAQSGNMNAINDLHCCGVCLGPQSCLSVAIRERYCSCVDMPVS